MYAKLQGWPVQDVKVTVITDGERILGLGELHVCMLSMSHDRVCKCCPAHLMRVPAAPTATRGDWHVQVLALLCSKVPTCPCINAGDLGANGMGISEGKITLYTAAAGVNPTQCLPIAVDIGTNNQALLESPDYKGIKQQRITGKEYFDFMDEVMSALKAWQPHMLIQFEDFGNHNAFHLLDTYRKQCCSFNDDIQGTACITLAGLLSAARLTGKTLSQHRILFLGAGEAGTGIGQLIATYLQLKYGMTAEEGRQHCFFLDSKGLVCKSRTGNTQTALLHASCNAMQVLEWLAQPAQTRAGLQRLCTVLSMRHMSRQMYNAQLLMAYCCNPAALTVCLYILGLKQHHMLRNLNPICQQQQATKVLCQSTSICTVHRSCPVSNAMPTINKPAVRCIHVDLSPHALPQAYSITRCPLLMMLSSNQT